MTNLVKKFIKEEQGQGMTEYGLILGVIAIGAIAALTLFGNDLVAKIGELQKQFFPEATPTDTNTVS